MNVRKRPTVFVSSTCYDLKQIRRDIKEFIEEGYGFEAMLSEFDSFPVDPCVGTFENCLNNVDTYADIFILIVGNRYGCTTDAGKSITNLEYLHAKQKGIPILAFVYNPIYNNLPIWQANKNADFSGIVDNSRIFEFVEDIYDESKQWVYTFNYFQDIKMTIKSQFALIFSDGLYFNSIRRDLPYAVMSNSLPAGAIRVLTEKPYAWEYKFLAYVIRNEFDRMKVRRWDLEYGFFHGDTLSLAAEPLLDQIMDKVQQASKIVDTLGVLINHVIPDAIADPGKPSDLEKMVYVAKRLAAIYERLIDWGLLFKCIQTDERFTHLLDLLYQLPKFPLNDIDAFVNELYDSITKLPSIYDGKERKIKLTCTLGKANFEEINEEISRIARLL